MSYACRVDALAYLWRHPDVLGVQSLWSLAAAFGAALAAAAVLSAAALLGELVAGRRLEPPAAAALGLGLLGHALILLGSAGALLLLPAAAFGLPALRRALSGPRPHRVVLLAGGWVLFSLAVRAAAPPTDWDALAYHLPIVQAFLESGPLVRLEPWLHAGVPAHMETLYMAAMALAGECAPAFVHLGTLLLLLSSLRGAVPKAGGLACLLLMCQPAVLQAAPTAGSDLGCALFCLWAVRLWIRWVEAGERRDLAFSGLFLGMAVSSKFVGLFAAAPLGFLILARCLRLREGRAFAAWAACALLAGAPWYLRNAVYWGNPFYPYLADWFSADPAMLSLAARAAAKAVEGVPKTALNLVLLPLRLVWDSPRFWAEPGWLWGSFLLALAAGARRPGLRARCAAAFGAGYLLLWFAVVQNGRLLLPVMPWLALAAAALALEAWSAGPWRRALAAGALAAGLAPILRSGPGTAAFAALDLVPRGAPVSGRERYKQLLVEPYESFSWMDENLPADAKVLLAGEVRGYYLRRPYVWGDPLNEVQLGYERLADARALAARLRGLGVTHVQVSPGLPPLLPEVVSGAAAKLDGLLKRAVLLHEARGYRVYQI